MTFINDIEKRTYDFYAMRFEPKGARALADMYWRAVLVCATLIVLGTLGWGVWQLVNSLDTIANTPDTAQLPPAAFDRTVLQRIVEGFSTRQTEYQSLQSEPQAPLADPSK